MKSILNGIDFEDVSENAQKESRNREKYLPPMSTYRWWARRTSAVSDAVVESAIEMGNLELLCDPFAGGGTYTLSALKNGISVYGQDINPWAASGLATMLDLPSVGRIRKSANRLEEVVGTKLRSAYRTSFRDGDEAQIAHTLRVAVTNCPKCGNELKLYPHAIVTLLKRKDSGGDTGWLACSSGHLTQGSIHNPPDCTECGKKIDPDAQYTEGRLVKCTCGKQAKISTLSEEEGINWKPVLVERAAKGRREIGKPRQKELDNAKDEKWSHSLNLGSIPQNKETRVLRRHGYDNWTDCYPDRQLHILETLLRQVKEVATSRKDSRALRIAIIGSTEMAGHLSRWDRWYLKAYEAMANHRYNFSTLSCEPNVWGAQVGRGTVRRRIKQLEKASEWLGKSVPLGVTVQGVLRSDSDKRNEALPDGLAARVVVGSSENIALPNNTTSLIFTDPPYHDDVRYGDLSALFRAWTNSEVNLEFEAVASQNSDCNYRQQLTKIFSECKRVLKPEGHLVISFANRDPNAWTDLFQSLIDAGFESCGFGLVHSENETDHSKRGIKSCTLDLVLDLVHSENHPNKWDGSVDPKTGQERYLNLIGKSFLKHVNPCVEENWKKDFIGTIEDCNFINK